MLPLANIFAPLTTWDMSDNWIVVTAALAGMACALPGVFLLLRRQSMMGDALSHTVLPGVAAAFLISHALLVRGVITPDTYQTTWHAVLFIGAVITGVLTALLTEAVRRLGGVESSAALGVVFTTVFAIGLIMIRTAADSVDLDCVLYGLIETVVLDTLPGTNIPRAAAVNAGVLVLNLVLLAVFYKEMKLSSFDPALATTLGINAQLMHYGAMAVTAVALVAAFESVGSILVVAMLIVPAATAHLLTDRLGAMISISVGAAALSALLGHALALIVPPAVFGPLGYPSVQDCSTAGMIAVAAGLLFVAAWMLSPSQGMVSRVVRRLRLAARIAAEDILGILYRDEEHGAVAAGAASGTRSVAGSTELHAKLAHSTWLARWSLRQLMRRGQVALVGGHYQLTPDGRRAAAEVVRGHRLLESYLATHLGMPDRKQHESAHQLEHFLDEGLRDELASQLGSPNVDPHGRTIPPASSP